MKAELRTKLSRLSLLLLTTPSIVSAAPSRPSHETCYDRNGNPVQTGMIAPDGSLCRRVYVDQNGVTVSHFEEILNDIPGVGPSFATIRQLDEAGNPQIDILQRQLFTIAPIAGSQEPLPKSTEVIPQVVTVQQPDLENQQAQENVQNGAVEAGQVITKEQIQKIEEELGVISPSPETWVEPVPDRANFRPSGDFGSVVDYQTNKFHSGVDYYASEGEAFRYFYKDGLVVWAGWWPEDGDRGVNWQSQGIGHGWTVWVELGKRTDGKPVYVTWAHMQPNIAVSPGQRLKPGDVIGYAGSSGFSNFVHTHTEFRVGGGVRLGGVDSMGRSWDEGNWQNPHDWFGWLSGKKNEPPKESYSNSNIDRSSDACQVTFTAENTEIIVPPLGPTGDPLFDKIPTSIIPDGVRRWGPTIKPIAQAFNYDPRLKLIFMTRENAGGDPFVVNGECRQDGLYQVTPGNRQHFLTVARTNPWYSQLARALGVDISKDRPFDARQSEFLSDMHFDFNHPYPKGPIRRAGTPELERYIAEAVKAAAMYNAGTDDDAEILKIFGQIKLNIVNGYRAFAADSIRKIAAIPTS